MKPEYVQYVLDALYSHNPEYLAQKAKICDMLTRALASNSCAYISAQVVQDIADALYVRYPCSTDQIPDTWWYEEFGMSATGQDIYMRYCDICRSKGTPTSLLV